MIDPSRTTKSPREIREWQYDLRIAALDDLIESVFRMNGVPFDFIIERAILKLEQLRDIYGSTRETVLIVAGYVDDLIGIAKSLNGPWDYSISPGAVQDLIRRLRQSDLKE